MWRDLTFFLTFCLMAPVAFMVLGDLFGKTATVLLVLPAATLAAELISRPTRAKRDPQARHGWAVARCCALLVLVLATPAVLFLWAIAGAAIGGPSSGVRLSLGATLALSAFIVSLLTAPVLWLLRRNECASDAPSDSLSPE